MPLSAWLGWTESPGDVPGYGPVDADDSRTLAGLLAQRPGNQWCVTLTDPAGHPIAHACARHGPPGPPGRATATTRGNPAPAPGPGQRASPVTLVPRATTHPHHPGPRLAARPDLRHPANQGLHPPPGITRLPARPVPAPPHPGPQPHLHRHPAAAAPPPAATSTMPSPTTAAAAPANATCTLCAGGITGRSRPMAGAWGSPNPGYWCGPRRADVRTPPHPPVIRAGRTPQHPADGDRPGARAVRLGQNPPR